MTNSLPAAALSSGLPARSSRAEGCADPTRSYRASMPSPFVELEVDTPTGERTVKVTNPEKTYFSGLPEGEGRKLDLVEYYLAVGEGAVRAPLLDQATVSEGVRGPQEGQRQHRPGQPLPRPSPGRSRRRGQPNQHLPWRALPTDRPPPRDLRP